jgi:endonuclease I
MTMAAPGVTTLADVPDGYYDAVDSSTSKALRDSLHEIIDDHTRFPYTSSATDTWDVLELADQDMQDPNRIVTIYRNSSVPKWSGGASTYNREHTWPRSYGFPDNDASMNYPFTDMHHLFLSDGDYNFFRSNKPFQDCDSSCVEYATQTANGRGGEGNAYPGDSNWTTGEFTAGRWEVWSHRKGDIARAMMYMDIRYEGGTHGSTAAAEPDLSLTDDRGLIDQFRTNSNESQAYMGILSTLLEWHEKDPVDPVEIQHHETVASFQGNRNPFIDHPQWAACIYQEQCFTINAGLNDAWVSADAPFQGMFITVFPGFKLVFLAWFTFDSVITGNEAAFGAGDQRWVTALGSYAGARADLKAELTSGGMFNASVPLPVQDTDYGSIVLEFSDCKEATVQYSFPQPGLSGRMTITRTLEDNVATCEALAAE